MDNVRTVREIAELVAGSVEGDASVVVSGVAPLDQAGPGQLTFACDERYADRLAQSQAAATLVGPAVKAGGGKTLIRVTDVSEAVAKVLALWDPGEDLPPPGVHPSAVVAGDAQLGLGAAIGPGVVIGAAAAVGDDSALCAGVRLGAGARVGRRCVLREGVVVYSRCLLGDRVRIGPNSVIGREGFGYYPSGGRHHRVPHIGNVVIEDDVELGACCCVDRGKFSATRIGEGAKVDNLVQIAHNAQIGRHCLIASLVGIAGSARMGDYTVIGGHSGLRDNISVGSNVRIAAFAGVTGDLADGADVAGMPARPNREALRIYQAQARLPELLRRVKDLEARLGALELPKDHL
jgi:UDP-3-O-[3-hydroxymyristoyl] glucosamine N-acyltransferase